jgi:hypothetical protein
MVIRGPQSELRELEMHSVFVACVAEVPSPEKAEVVRGTDKFARTAALGTKDGRLTCGTGKTHD